MLDPVAVGAQRLHPACGVVRGAGTERDHVEVSQAGEVVRTVLHSGGQGCADTDEGVLLVVQWRQVGGQEAHPRGPLDVLFRQPADLGVEPERRRFQRQQTTVSESDLLGQREGVSGSAQAGEQRRAIAVVLGTTLAVDAHLVATNRSKIG